MCGKDRLGGRVEFKPEESPPHVREGQTKTASKWGVNRITPACAGRTAGLSKKDGLK